MNKLICEVCNKNEAVGVAGVPGVPISVAYCRECLEANAHPWGIVIANTVCVGGLEHAADWWKEIVKDTCKHLGKSLDDFNAEVEKSLRLLEGIERNEKRQTQ
jgi:hypothetical protein